jgi:hypothetical protein
MLLIQTAILILPIVVVLRFAVRRHQAMTQFGLGGSVPRPTNEQRYVEDETQQRRIGWREWMHACEHREAEEDKK